MTIREVKELMQHQRFDVTALVASVGEIRNANQERCVVKVTIIDDSAAQSTVQELNWSFWTNTNATSQERATMDILRESVGTNKPISFFALDGKKRRTAFKSRTRKTSLSFTPKGKERKSSPTSPHDCTLSLKLLAMSLKKVSNPLVAILTMNKARRPSVRY